MIKLGSVVKINDVYERVRNYDEIHTLVPESKKTLDSFPNSLYQDSPAWMLLFDTIRWMPLYD